MYGRGLVFLLGFICFLFSDERAGGFLCFAVGFLRNSGYLGFYTMGVYFLALASNCYLSGLGMGMAWATGTGKGSRDRTDRRTNGRSYLKRAYIRRGAGTCVWRSHCHHHHWKKIFTVIIITGRIYYLGDK